MRNKRISTDSSSDSFSDDDILSHIPLKRLKMIKMNGYTPNPNSYSSLCEHSIQACEFCDKISKNRYSSLIHNVSHIIIPLLNQTVFQCQTCLHHFTSEEDLYAHSLKKHPNLNITPQMNNDIHVRNKSLSVEQDSTQNLKQDSTVKTKDESKKQSIKNRLVFEDDDVIFLDCSDQLLNDLTTDCKVNLEVFETPWLNNEFRGKSVHYDELVTPGVYRCKKCGKRFPIRYDAIIHETSHLTFKDTQVSLCIICQQYMRGDKSKLRLHYLIHHKEKAEKQTQTYNYYEPEPMINKRIVFEEDKNNLLENKRDPLEDRTEVLEDKRTIDSKIEFMCCELCFSFCKNTQGKNYECVKTVSEIGKRFNCEKCGLKFFEIMIVRRQCRRTLHYKIKKHTTNEERLNKRKKHTTNEERLKLITQRFKMMKH